MSALALAMMLTGAGAVQPAEPAYPVIVVPAPPAPPPPVRIGPPAPPLPPGYGRAARPPQRARLNLNSYFSVDDYPASALRDRHQGTTGVRLTVGANGRIVACDVITTSGSAALDAATCRILRSRARYTPARDAGGTPVQGTDFGRVTWRLSDRGRDSGGRAGIPVPAIRAVLRGRLQDHFTARDYPVPALRARAAGRTIVRLVVGTEGRVIACDVAGSSRSEALDAAACRIVRARARYAPARGAAGAPACDVFWGPVEWVPPPFPRRLRRARPESAPPPIERQLAPGACPGRTP